MKQSEHAIIKKIRIEGRKNHFTILIIDIIFEIETLYLDISKIHGV